MEGGWEWSYQKSGWQQWLGGGRLYWLRGGGRGKWRERGWEGEGEKWEWRREQWHGEGHNKRGMIIKRKRNESSRRTTPMRMSRRITMTKRDAHNKTRMILTKIKGLG